MLAFPFNLLTRGGFMANYAEQFNATFYSEATIAYHDLIKISWTTIMGQDVQSSESVVAFVRSACTEISAINGSAIFL